MATDSAWTKSIYGTDLDWATDPSYSPLVTVGNGTAHLIWRRVSGIIYYTLRIIIGSTTSIPAGSGWFFEFPDVFSNVNDTNVIFPPYVWSSSGQASVAAATDTVVDVSGQLIRPGYTGGSITNLAHPTLIPFALSFDTSGGALTKTSPGTWAAGDFFSASGWAACLDN